MYGTDKDAAHVYMLFEFCQGGELFTLLRDNGYLPEEVGRYVRCKCSLSLSLSLSLPLSCRGLTHSFLSSVNLPPTNQKGTISRALWLPCVSSTSTTWSTEI